LINRPKKALVIASGMYANGGIQRFNRTFLTACDNLGVACDVVSLGDSADEVSRWSAPSSAAVSVYDYHRLRFALAVASRVLRGNYDFIVIGHVNLLRLVVAATRMKRRARVILIAHGIEVWTGLSGSRRHALRKVDSILCVSHYTRHAIQSQAPELPQDRFVIFPNALSESWREQPSAQPGAHTEVELLMRLPKKFLLSVTRLDRGERYKGIITVLEALSMIDDRSVHYVVAGHGNDAQFIAQVADRLGVTSRVHFVGSVSDVELAALYRECAAFVLPSGKEGFGIVFLEAMFFGACVIAAREKGAVDVVQHEQTGLLVPYGDSVALKLAIDRVVADTAFNHQMAMAGRATVTGDGAFTFQSYVARLARALNIHAPMASAGPNSASDSKLTTSLDETCV
jgi:phosphatidylinositol alpha-1,6-mannosyltransferase